MCTQLKPQAALAQCLSAQCKNRASLAPRTLLQFYYDEIRNLRLQGGDVIVSFGGANGQELAQVGGCEVQGRQGHMRGITPCPCHACESCCC